jgi:polyhydroxybutyrate depolymerase
MKMLERLGRWIVTSHFSWLVISFVILTAGVLVVVLLFSAMARQKANGHTGTKPGAPVQHVKGAEARGPSESQKRTLRIAGRERSYVLYIPANLDREKPIPLVLAFHGRLGTGQLMEQMTGFSEIAERGFIVAYPDGIGRSWNAGHGVGLAESEGVDDVDFIARLIDALSAEFKIDERRIYAAGMSNGGMFAYRLACELKGRIAAVASVAGPLPPEIAAHCDEAGAVSILHIQGTADPIVPWAGGEASSGGKILSADATIRQWASVNKCSEQSTVTLSKGNVLCRSNEGCAKGAEVTLCTVDGGGHTWPGSRPLDLLESVVGPTNQDVNATEMIWDFFSHHELAADGTPPGVELPTESSISGPAEPRQVPVVPIVDAGAGIGLRPE